MGDPKKKIFLPLELLEPEQQVCPPSKIRDKETTKMIKVTAVPPAERQERIKKALKSSLQKNATFAQAFGIRIENNFSVIKK